MYEFKPGFGNQIPPHVPPELVFDFDLYHLPGDGDFHGSWKSFQNGRPDLVWTPHNGGHWIAMRGKLIHEIFTDHEHFSSQVVQIPRERFDDIDVLPTKLDPPHHQPYRALLNAGLSPAAVRRIEPDIRALVIATIEGFRDRGACEFVTEFAEVLPIQIFMRIVGLPGDDALMLKEWTNEIVRSENTDKPAEMMARFADYLRPYIVQRQATPGADLISSIVTGNVNGAPLSEKEAIDLCTQVMLGGLDTVISFLGFIFLFLARNPGHRRQLCEDPSLIPSAVEEFFRRFPIVLNTRMVVADYSFHGVQLKAEDLILLPGVLHGLDEREHEDPLAVDFKRKRTSAAHSTFGNGVHRCPGTMLARAEMRIALEEWLRRIPDFELSPGEEAHTTGGGLVATVTRLPLRWEPQKTVELH